MRDDELQWHIDVSLGHVMRRGLVALAALQKVCRTWCNCLQQPVLRSTPLTLGGGGGWQFSVGPAACRCANYAARVVFFYSILRVLTVSSAAQPDCLWGNFSAACGPPYVCVFVSFIYSLLRPTCGGRTTLVWISSQHFIGDERYSEDFMLTVLDFI